MIPNLSKSGHSFKGAFSYHMHDKDRDDTGERVAWTSARNLMTDDARTAERVMIATAQDSDRLKEQAGVKATGRKSTAHVQTFSLAWHPDEKVSREEMERAADSALKELGLENHQAYLVAHSDRPHQHVHVIVNRIDPRDGRMAGLSNSKRILDSWAHRYEQSRGQIVSPNRAAKYERQEKARKQYSQDERRAYMERKHQAQDRHTEARRETIQKAGAKTATDAQKATDEAGIATSRAQVLRDLHEAQNTRHKNEWHDLRLEQWGKEKHAGKEWGQRVKATREAFRDDAKSKLEWKELGRSHGRSLRAERKMEKTLLGRLSLAITAAKAQREILIQQGKKAPSLAKMTWANLASREQRRETFDAIRGRERDALRQRQAERLKPMIERLEGMRTDALRDLKARHESQRDSLKRRQDAERGKMREAWRQVPWAERQQVWGAKMSQEQKKQQSRDQFASKDARERGGKVPRDNQGEIPRQSG